MMRSLPLLSAALLSLAAVSVAVADPAETRKILCADSSKGRIAIIDAAGKVEWEYKIGPLHDLHLLPSGNVLFQTGWTRIVEIDPRDSRVVWEYDAGKQNGNAGRPVEVHAFERLENGWTMIAESGPGRIIEVDAAGKIQREIRLQVKKPHPHTDTRLVRRTAAGTYLVCQEGDGVVREYDSAGKIVWEFEVPLFGKEPRGGHGPEAFGNKCYSALRLANGNTLIGTGNGHSVIEVTPQKEVVWRLTQKELPGITLAWVTTTQVLPNGNIVIGNCHAGDANPQVIEITRDKKVVWQFRDFERFGNAFTNTQVLEVNGKKI